MPAMSAVPSWTDGQVVHAGPFNTLAADIDALAQQTVGFPTRRGASTRPLVKCHTLNPQPVPSGQVQFVSFDTAAVSTDNMYFQIDSTALQVQTAGWYRIDAQAAFDVGTQASRIARLYVNGTADANAVASSVEQMGTPSSSSQTSPPPQNFVLNIRLQVSAFEHLAEGSVVLLGVFQDTGSSVNLFPISQWGTWIAARWEAPY